MLIETPAVPGTPNCPVLVAVPTTNAYAPPSVYSTGKIVPAADTLLTTLMSIVLVPVPVSYTHLTLPTNREV